CAKDGSVVVVGDVW
nr:immunoglobulin heavy chain junction region [Macaca mulatta]MOY21159.1 immunoglobulin heavy chain junction region [Macaca mulatta]MOY21418.1 immunoglobulin heavy chain junction region [Macaca mulatta]MOY22056.1 immunoglobulin heavy chain junction region [Macaca mulatta]MOY22704.1 immunoglobulin heavy chain junction region [Macaca mulatta]